LPTQDLDTPPSLSAAEIQLELDCRVPVRNELSSIYYMDVIFRFDDSITHSISRCKGLGGLFSVRLTSRFEIKKQQAINKVPLKCLVNGEIEALDDILAKVIPDKFQILDLMRVNILRKFVIRSYQGLCHAHGKPVYGQRT